jgi:hypothetical protein
MANCPLAAAKWIAAQHWDQICLTAEPLFFLLFGCSLTLNRVRNCHGLLDWLSRSNFGLDIFLECLFANVFNERHYFFFAVLADSLKALAVGAPLVPGLRILSGVFPAAF